MRYAIAEASSIEGFQVRSTRSGFVAPVPERFVGALGGMKSADGSPPFSAAQSTVPPLAAAIASRKEPYEPFGVRSAHSGPDCHPPRIGSSASRKLKNAPTYPPCRQARRGHSGRLRS